MSKDMTQGRADWQPQRRGEDGVYLAGDSGLPANHRLRAERLAATRRKSDPDGIIADELIAETATRLKAEASAEAKGEKAGAEPAGGE
jgi:hypothetical protein